MICGMETFSRFVLAPFVCFGMLLIAYPFKRAVLRMKDGRIKRFLLIRW